jgi:hypothetical protein
VPVLLDTTPIPEELREFQWVDFQQLLGSGHMPDRSDTNLSRHRSYKSWITFGLVSVLIMLSFVLILFLPALYSPEPPVLGEPSRSKFYGIAVVTVLLVVAVGAVVVWKLIGHLRVKGFEHTQVDARKSQEVGAPAHTLEIRGDEQLNEMVHALRLELFRRGIDLG